MADPKILSTAEFLSNMKKTTLGRDTDLTFGDAQALSPSGINIADYLSDGEYQKTLEQEQEENQNWWDWLRSSLSEVGKAAYTGIIGMFEGLVDVGATMVSNVMDWAGADTTDINNFISTNYSERYAEMLQNFNDAIAIPYIISDLAQGKTPALFSSDFWSGNMNLGMSDAERKEWREDYTYNKDLLEERGGWFGSTTLAVVGAVSQAAAQFGLGQITGGNRIVTLGTMGVSAVGQGTQEALKEDADIHTATMYGLLSGATEVATEIIGGYGADIETGVAGKMLRKTTLGSKFLNSIGGQIVGNFIAEGLEEVMADAVNPLWKKITYDPDLELGEEYTSLDFWSELGTSFVVGGIAGGIMGGIKSYRDSKTKINGKKVGIEGANALSQFSSVSNELQTRINKAISQFSDMVGENIDSIPEGTDIREAMKNAMESKEFSESDRKKLTKLVDRVNAAVEQFKTESDSFNETMDKLGITTDDLVTEYGESREKQLKKLASNLKIKTNNADLSQTGSNFVLETNNTLTIDSTTTNDLTVTSADIVINNETLIDKSSDFVIGDEATNNQVTQRLESVADTRGLQGEEREQFVRKNRAVEVVRNVVQNAGLDANNEAAADIVAESLNESTTMDEAIARATFEKEQLPDTSRRHNIGGKEIAQVQKQKYSAGFSSMMNKLVDDSYAVGSLLKRMGATDAEVNETIRKIRSSAGVGARVTEKGFFNVVYENGKYKIVDTTKGLYNGKDGIVDIMRDYATSKGMGFDEVNSLVQEGLSLLDESDRGQITYDYRSLTSDELESLRQTHPELAERIDNKEIISQEEFEQITATDNVKYSSHAPKSVFGEFYSRYTLTEEQLNNLKEAHENLYERIIDGESISEAEFKEATRGDKFEYTGKLLTKEQIDARLAQIREKVTNFDEITKWVYEINDKVLEMRRDSGMISQEDYEYWKKTKPHYVPEFRVLLGQNANGENGIKILNTGLHEAKGSNLVIQDIFLSIQSQIAKVHRFKAMNDLINELYTRYTGLEGNVDGIGEVTSAPWVTEIDQDIGELTQAFVNGQTIYGYRNGEQLQMRVNPEIAESLNSLNGTLRQFGENSRLLGAIRKAAGVVRNLMTTWNPFFSWFRNPIKDIQGAMIYTKNGTATLLKNWGRALTQVVSNSELFQIYQTMSGQTLLLKDSYKGTGEKSFYKDLKRGQLSKTIRTLAEHYSNANEIMEHTTRFAEFISTFERLTKQGVEYRKAIQTAMVDANEITINFSRKGIYTRVLNQYVPFLTANIEGAARNIRAFISPKSAKEWASLILKMLILGLAPQIIQELIYRDDEDYQSLADTMKTNYYLIKAGDQFIRIPKGFIQQAFSGDVVLASKYAHGEDVDFNDWKVAGETNWNAIGVDVSGVFFQPIIDAKNNKTWYGGEIVSGKWTNTRPSEQYTDDTSEISKFFGKIFGISPLKVQYVLDQMTGIAGDILLPLTSKKGFTNPLEVFKGQFISDPVYKNKLSSDFYNYKQNVTFNKTDGDVVAKAVLSYLNKCSTQIQDFKNLQDEVAQDTSLSQEERNSQDRVYQTMMNVLYKESISNAKLLEEELKHYELSEESYETDVREAVRQSLGAENALRMAGERVYRKAQTYNRIGLSYDDFYTHYYNMRNMGDKEQITRYISRLRIGANLKNLLYRLAGFRLDSEKITLLRLWLKNKGLTEEEIDFII